MEILVRFQKKFMKISFVECNLNRFNILSVKNSTWNMFTAFYKEDQINFWIVDSYKSLPIEFYLAFSITLFLISLLGLSLNKQKNIIIFMLFVELMLFSLGYTSIILSIYWLSPIGQIFSLFITSIAVVESAIGLGLLINIFKLYKRIEFDNFSNLKG